MSAEQNALTRLATSIADGAPIDWEQAERAASPEQRRLVRRLRLVSSVAELYRSLPSDATPGPQPSLAEPEGVRWGHLVLAELLGRGTSAEVHRAWDLELQREVALKLFPAHPEMPPHVHAQVLSEARRLARVRHRNVATVYGADRDGDRVGFWMELVHGASIQELLDRDGPFGPRETAVVGIELCGALAAVHGAGLLHRDIKAQNVLRETGGRIVLTDFGTGEDVQSASTRMAGTPMYFAPEILAGRPATAQSDLYSLGVLLFYMATGEFPVSARTMQDLARAHKTGAVRHLRDVRPDLPAPFVQVVERLLSPDPAARYQTAGALESALRATLEAGHVPGTPASPATEARRHDGARSRGLVAASVLLIASAVALALWFAPWRATGPPLQVQSIAVLPLVDLTGGAGPPHLSEVLTDQLISTLGQLHGLRVTPRTSIQALGTPPPAVREIASRLGVASVLEATVTVADGSVLVNARIVAAGSETQIWSGSFERQLGETFALQAELARAIAREVKVAISPGEAARLDRRQVTSPDAEAAYFQGRYYLNQYGAANASQALSAFERARRLDVNYAPAYVGLARTYVRLGLDGALMHTEARAQALAMAQRALELDDQSAEAHTALADVMFYYDWNWKRAEDAYRRAVDLNPSSAETHQQYARYLSAMGRLDDAIQEARRAADVDPLSSLAAQVHGLMLYYARRHGEAAAVLQHAHELDPESAGTHVILSRVREAQQRYAEALAEANKALAIAEHPGVRAHAARQMALSGDHAAARAELEKVYGGSLQARPEHVAYARLALGETDEALDLLERAEDEREPPILWLSVDPRVDGVRAHPRFTALVDRIGLPPASLDPLRPGH